MKLEQLINDYKKGGLTNRLPKAGSTNAEGQHAHGVDAEESLKSNLSDFWSFNNKILVVIMVVLIAFIIFLGVLIWKFNNQTSMVVSLIAGESGGIYFAINRMHALYKESMAAKMLYQLLQNASTSDEKNKIIDSINDFIRNQ